MENATQHCVAVDAATRRARSGRFQVLQSAIALSQFTSGGAAERQRWAFSEALPQDEDNTVI